MNKILSIVTLFVLMVPVIWGQDTVTDIDGNVYQTVQIGDQVWMAENLKVTHYRNGDEIPTGYSNEEWVNLSTGAYSVYPADTDGASQTTCGDDCAEVYGNMYNWFTVGDVRGVCPASWNVPTEAEWTELEVYIMNDGYAGIEGNALKEIGYEHWYNDGNPDHEGLDIYGFTGLPGGYRISNDGNYYSMGSNGYFWSSTEYSNSNAWSRVLNYIYSGIYRYNYNNRGGFSVRCLRYETDTDTILVPHSTGWNIVGLPLDVDDASYNLLFPESIEGTLYSFDNGYNLETTLIHGQGYWLRFNEEGSTTITGIPINELTISLNEGWNLISGITTPVDISDIQDPDGIIISGTIYGFTPDGYSNIETIEPGKGYWVRTNDSGSITLIGD